MLHVAVDARVRAGGVGRYSAALLAELQQRNDLVVTTFPGAGWRAASFTPWGSRAVGRFVGRNAPGLFHSLHLEVPPRLTVPSVVTIHDVIPLSFSSSMPSGWKRRVFRSILERSLHDADAIVCPSTLTRDDLLSRGAEAGRLHVIPNGLGPGFSPSTPTEREHARRRFSLGRRYVATLSHPRPHKNADILGSVARFLERAGCSLASVGSPSEATVSHRSLSDPDLRLFLGGAEVFLLPSLLEGFGYPVLESLACGTPVVCGPRVGAVAHLKGGVELADVEDGGTVAEVLLELLRDDERRERLATEGRRSAAALSAEEMASATVRLYGVTAASR